MWDYATAVQVSDTLLGLGPMRPRLATMEGSMTDHRNERDDERKRTEEADERRRDERGRRSDDLQEAWRRHHPSEKEDGGKDRPKKRHPA